MIYGDGMSWAHYNLAAAHGSVGGLTRIRQQGVSEGPDPRLDYSSIYTSFPRGLSSSLITPLDGPRQGVLERQVQASCTVNLQPGAG